MNKKYYLIQLVDSQGATFLLRRNGKVFHRTNHGLDKTYKSLRGAKKKAQSIQKKINALNRPDKINVVQVTFRPCNPLLPDGFYEPVNEVVASF